MDIFMVDEVDGNGQEMMERCLRATTRPPSWPLDADNGAHTEWPKAARRRRV